MIPTFRPWTHTSDDSYIYQLSLVVATATVSYVPAYDTYSVRIKHDTASELLYILISDFVYSWYVLGFTYFCNNTI